MLHELMKKRILAGAFTLGMLGLLAVPAVVGAVIGVDTDFGLKDPSDSFETATQLGKKGVKETVAQIINIILGFLGIVAVIIILAGGFKWMTAGGNEDKVGESRKMIIQGVIGLVIIFASWAIASFVVTQLGTATGTTG